MEGRTMTKKKPSRRAAADASDREWILRLYRPGVLERGLAVLAQSAGAVADPAFAAIERHRIATAAFRLAGSRTAYVIKAAKEDEDAEQEAGDAQQEELVELVSAPMTLAGVKAVLEYVAQLDEGPEDLNEFLGHLLRSPIFAA
jgi:hypothetical protein